MENSEGIRTEKNSLREIYSEYGQLMTSYKIGWREKMFKERPLLWKS